MADNELIHVMICDDHDMVRYGLSIFLQSLPDIELVGEARDGEEAIDLVAETNPDVVLMDLVMPHTDGVEATRYICDNYPHIRVIALTSFGDQETIQTVLDAGAVQCLPKNTPHDQLADAIREAYG